ncbi:MAG: hypothetical protein ABJF01_02480 [bacterium]
MTEPERLEKAEHAKHESPVRRIFVESALIVFSILLALAANQWNDSRKQHALAGRALTAVREEIASNIRNIGLKRPYHGTMWIATKRADSLRLVHSLANFYAVAPAWSGFMNPEYDGTAWQSALSLGAVGSMGFDTVRTLSRLYALQGKIDAYASNIESFDFADAAMASTVRRMYVYFATVATNEDTLVNRYTQALKLLDPPKEK